MMTGGDGATGLLTLAQAPPCAHLGTNEVTMSIRQAIEVVTELAERGTIKSYAIAGAVAALNYIEPTLTQDLDILIAVGDFEQRRSGLILLTPIEQALADMGFRDRHDAGIIVAGWPVQFLPAGSELDEEALAQAVDAEIFDNPPLMARVLRAEHLIATALRVGRLKDLARIDAFLDQGQVDLVALKSVIVRFDLLTAWKAFCLKSGRADSLAVE
jgi:hypothetical protein